jgi:hypothetical protein
LQDTSDKSRASTGDDSIAQLAKPTIVDVFKKNFNREQQDVIVAMLVIADPLGKGRLLHIRVPRIAAWAKMEERTVQRTLWGDHRSHPGRPAPRDPNGKRIVPCPLCEGLVQLRVLQQVEKANARGKRRPATYRLNLDLVDDSPRVRAYLDRDASWLDFPEPTKRPTVAPARDPRSDDQRPTVASGATHGRTEVKAFDSKATIGTAREKGEEPVVIPARACVEAEVLPPLPTLIRGILEQTGLPVVPPNLAAVGAAVEAIQKRSDRSYPECCDWMVQRVRKAVEAGVCVNRFWFEDGKYLLPQSAAEKSELKAQQAKAMWEARMVREQEISPDRVAEAETARARMPRADPKCPACDGSGWKPAPGPGHRVTRCHCMTSQQREAGQ